MTDTLTNDPIVAGLEKMARQEIVRAAAGRAIFCPDCNDILDYKSAALVTPLSAATGRPVESRACISCGPCLRSLIKRQAKKHRVLDRQILALFEVLTGSDALEADVEKMRAVRLAL